MTLSKLESLPPAVAGKTYPPVKINFAYVRHAKLYPLLVCCNFKFDLCKFTKVILQVEYIIYAFKSYFQHFNFPFKNFSV